MAQIVLRNVSVAFPIFGARAYSLKTTVAATATGGRIGRDAGLTVVEALRGVDLDLQDGDRLGVTGHNGAGKSTLLRVIAGVYPPTKGTLRRTGSVSSLIEPMLGIELDATGYENIYIRGLIAGSTLAGIRQLTPDIAEFSGLGDYLAMPARSYSTGMLMRLAFSIATAVPAEILIMDEWLAVGDVTFQAQAEQRLRAILAKTGILVLASHSPTLIAAECNRLATISHGILTQDSASELFAHGDATVDN